VVEPDLTTITSPFIGVSKTLDASLIKEALVRLNMLKGRANLKFELTLSQKAGPNGKISLFNTAIDALAFILYPKNLLSFIMFNIKTYKFRGILFNI